MSSGNRTITFTKSIITMFFFKTSVDPKDLHSFPTRRSSDLWACAAVGCVEGCATTRYPVMRSTTAAATSAQRYRRIAVAYPGGPAPDPRYGPGTRRACRRGWVTAPALLAGGGARIGSGAGVRWVGEGQGIDQVAHVGRGQRTEAEHEQGAWAHPVPGGAGGAGELPGGEHLDGQAGAGTGEGAQHVRRGRVEVVQVVQDQQQRSGAGQPPAQVQEGQPY